MTWKTVFALLVTFYDINVFCGEAPPTTIFRTHDWLVLQVPNWLTSPYLQKRHFKKRQKLKIDLIIAVFSSLSPFVLLFSSWPAGFRRCQQVVALSSADGCRMKKSQLPAGCQAISSSVSGPTAEAWFHLQPSPCDVEAQSNYSDFTNYFTYRVWFCRRMKTSRRKQCAVKIARLLGTKYKMWKWNVCLVKHHFCEEQKKH